MGDSVKMSTEFSPKHVAVDAPLSAIALLTLIQEVLALFAISPGHAVNERPGDKGLPS